MTCAFEPQVGKIVPPNWLDIWCDERDYAIASGRVAEWIIELVRTKRELDRCVHEGTYHPFIYEFGAINSMIDWALDIYDGKSST